MTGLSTLEEAIFFEGQPIATYRPLYWGASGVEVTGLHIGENVYFPSLDAALQWIYENVL